jgi:hypothetical protein
MQIRIRESGAVMYEDAFRRLNASTSFPQHITAETLSDFGADVVFEGPQATSIDPYQFSQAAGVELLDGKWYTKYIIGPVFADAEQEAAYKAQKDAEQAKSIRTSRNDLLKDCDWTQLADSTADKVSWATYRQALRDITAQVGFPFNIIWPIQPE